MKSTSRLLLAVAYALSLGCVSRAADVAISALPAASSVSSSNLTIVVDTAEPNAALRTKKATVGQLVDGLPAASSGAKGTMSAADKIKLDAATASSTANALVKRDGSGNAAFNAVALVGGTVSGAPSNPTDITNKAYVDAVSTGLAVHTPAVAATVGSNITLAGGAPSTLDGVSLSTNNRVLVKDQTDAKQNGIYFVATLGSGANGTWTRTTDADTGAELVSGSYIFINGGTTWASSAWVMTTPGAITIGTSDINWTLFNQVTNILAANIIGQIVQAQIADASINTAKLAAGIEPVSVVSSLPSPSGYTGPKSVFNTSDSKLYRYTGSAFVATTAAGDVTGQITTTQITDSSVTTAKVAAGAITATQIAADTITAGQIAAGAVNTSELAANAVTAAKILAGTITTTQIAAATILASNIAAGTITADRMNVSTLSAIAANVGTLTAGSIGGWAITTTSMSATSGSSTITLDATNAWLRASRSLVSATLSTDDPGTGARALLNLTYNSIRSVVLTGQNGGGVITVGDNSGFDRITIAGSTGGITLRNSSNVTKATIVGDTGNASFAGTLGVTGLSTLTGGFATSTNSSVSADLTVTRLLTSGGLTLGGRIEKTSSDTWGPKLYDGDNEIEFRWSTGLQVRIDGSTVLNVTTTP